MTTTRTSKHSRKALVALALATGLLASAAMPAQAAFPGKNGVIAFESAMTEGEGVDNPEGDSEIFTINPDGSGLKQITKNEDDDTGPAFSPDGRRIAFESNRDSASRANDIFTMNADGTRQRNLTDSADVIDGSPAFSPNGGQIAFHSRQNDNTDVYKMNADGSGQKNLTEDSASIEENPAFSPDGERIAFQSNRDAEGSGTDDIFVMNADGSRQKNLTETPDDIDYAANWSPDGKRLTFTIQDGRTGNNDVYTMKSDGSGQKNLTRNTPDSDDSHSAYSPNGNRIAFESDRDGNSALAESDIFVMKDDGSRQKNLTDRSGPFTSEPDWQSKRK